MKQTFLGVFCIGADRPAGPITQSRGRPREYPCGCGRFGADGANVGYSCSGPERLYATVAVVIGRAFCYTGACHQNQGCMENE